MYKGCHFSLHGGEVTAQGSPSGGAGWDSLLTQGMCSQERMLHLMSQSQETAVRHFRAFLSHLETDDSHLYGQHCSCTS